MYMRVAFKGINGKRYVRLRVYMMIGFRVMDWKLWFQNVVKYYEDLREKALRLRKEEEKESGDFERVQKPRF